jgi:hypothetical protein
MCSFPIISFQNPVIAKSFAGPFKSKIFKKHDTCDKSLQYKICEKAKSALLTPKVIPLVTYLTKWIKMFLRTLFNVAYYIYYICILTEYVFQGVFWLKCCKKWCHFRIISSMCINSLYSYETSIDKWTHMKKHTIHTNTHAKEQQEQ